MSNFCSTACVNPLNGWAEAGCDSPIRDGAVGEIVFLHCSVKNPVFGTPGAGETDLLDVATLQALSDACRARITPCLDGAKTAEIDQFIFGGVCAGDKYTKSTFTITFTSTNTEANAFDFWNRIKISSSKFQVGFFDGAGRFWGFWNIKKAEIAVQLENATSDATPPAKFTGTITIETRGFKAIVEQDDLLMSDNLTYFDEFLRNNINNDTACGGGGTPLPSEPAFIPEITSIDGNGGDTFTGDDAALISTTAVLALTTIKAAGCGSNIVATAGQWINQLGQVVTAPIISMTLSPVTFNQAAGASQTQNMQINYGASLVPGTYKCNINFVMNGGGSCTQSTTKTVTIVVT